MSVVDTRGILTTPGGGDDIYFDTTPGLDPDAVPAVLRFDTIIISDTTTIGDFFRFDRNDFIPYIAPFLPSTVSAKSIWIAHLRFVGDPTVLEDFATQLLNKVEMFEVNLRGGIQDGYRYNNPTAVSWSDNNNDLDPGPNLQIELLEMSYAGNPFQLVNLDKQVGKRKTVPEA